jgi:TDG/mug DNA glycosylase family protein
MRQRTRGSVEDARRSGDRVKTPLGAVRRPTCPLASGANGVLERPSKADLEAAVDGRLPDVVGQRLTVLFCGINPGLYSAAVGHHFARPGNRFWAALCAGGFTDRVLSPCDDRSLLEFGYGLTNLVDRATAGASELGSSELVAGRLALEAKVRRYAPRWVAVLGIGAYRTAFDRRRAVVGPQGEPLAGARVWVLPNTSGLNAHHRPADLAAAFRALRHALAAGVRN